MFEVLTKIWTFEYALVPCLAAYIVFDFTAIIRRITRKVYVPIYFMFFPFGFTDELYAQYFDEDDFQILGNPLTSEEKIEVRKKIVFISALSMVFSVVISPWIAATFSYFVLSYSQYQQFFYTLIILKSILLIKSLFDLRMVWQVTAAKLLFWIGVIYVVYLFAVVTNLHIAYDWVGQHYSSGGVSSLAWSVAKLFIQDIGLWMLGAAVIGAVIPWKLTSLEGNESE